MVKFWQGTPFNQSYKKALFRILIPTFFAGLGSLGAIKAILSPYISFLLENNLGYSEVVAEGLTSILVGIDVVAKLAISPITGYLADKYGRRKLVVIGLSIGIIAGLSLIWAYFFSYEIAIFSGIIAGVIVLGLETGQVNTAITISSGDTGEEYNKIGLTETLWDVSLISGMIIGIIISFVLDLTYLQSFTIGVISFIIGAILAFFVFRETKQPIGDQVKIDESKITINNYKDILKEKNFIPLFVFAFVVEAEESGLVFTIFPLIFQNFGFSSNEIPMLTLLPAVLTLAIVFAPMGWLSDKFGRKKLALIGCFASFFILIAMYLALSLYNAWSALIIMGIFLTIAVSAYRVPLMASITDMTLREKRGVPYGIFRAFREVGGSIAPLLFGILILTGLDLYSMTLITAIMTIIAFIIAIFTFRETKR